MGFKVKEIKLPESLDEKEKEGLTAFAKGFSDEIERGVSSVEDLVKKTTEEFSEIKSATKEQTDSFSKKLREIAEEVTALKEKASKGSPKDPMEILEKEHKEFFAQKEEGKAKSVKFQIKAENVVTTTNFPGNDTLLHTVNQTPIMPLLAKPNIFDALYKGRTYARTITWTNTYYDESYAKFVGENTLKPNGKFRTQEETSTAVKVAVLGTYAEEALKYFPNFQRIFNDLLTKDLTTVRDKSLLFGLGGVELNGLFKDASPYVAGSLDGQVIMPNLIDVINAMALQVTMELGNPDMVIVNPQDYFSIDLIKTSTGQYIASTDIAQRIKAMKIVQSHTIPPGNVAVLDSSVFNVETDGDISIRMGFGDGDFQNNRASVAIEQFIHSYHSQIHNKLKVYDQIENVIASLKTP